MRRLLPALGVLGVLVFLAVVEAYRANRLKRLDRLIARAKIHCGCESASWLQEKIILRERLATSLEIYEPQEE